MNAQTLRHPTLLDKIQPIQQVNPILRNILLAVAGTLVLTISAKIQIPFYPVPMTMQTLVVMMIGMILGPRLGTATLLLYFAEGLVGLPVFAGTPEKGIGLSYMLGSTGGYLAGFIFAAATCGWLAQRGWDRNVWKTAGALLIGNAIIYLPGLLWMAILFGFDKPILAWGLTPFILGDLLKVAIAALVLPLIWRTMSGRTGS